MKRITLTTDQIEAIRKIDNNGAGDRAGAYLALWQITGDPEALQQARIASFSGGVGGAAFGANLEIQKALGAKYPGVFSFSDQVFQSSMDNIEHNLDKINSGELSLSEAIFDGAKHAWAHVKLPNGTYDNLSPDFPGNLFAWNPASSNRLDTKAMTSPGTRFAVEGANEADLYGKSLNDFDALPGFSRHTLTNASGSSVVIVKDDHSRRTVYVGPGTDTLQTFADRMLIGDVEHPPEPRTDNYDYVQRETFLAIRQNEGPDTLSIGPSGVISIIKRASQNAPIGLPSYPAAELHAAIMANSPQRSTRA